MRHLDFIAFGVPRSGTTALGRSFNLHPDIFCGVERFNCLIDPNKIYFPNSFRNPAFQCNPKNLKSTNANLTLKGDGVALAGDKSPRYYCNLDQWAALKQPPKFVAIYRSPYEFLDSWRRRAAGAGDNWSKEQVGLFGLWETFALLHNSLNFADDTLFVPYDAMFFKNPDVVRRVIAHVGGDPARYNHEQFLKELFNQQHRTRSRPKLPDDEVRLLEAAAVDRLDKIMLVNDAFVIGERRQEIEKYLSSVPANLAELGEQWLSERASRSMSKYLRYWASLFPQLAQIPNPEAVPPTFKKYAAYTQTTRAKLIRNTARTLRYGLQRISRLSHPA